MMIFPSMQWHIVHCHFCLSVLRDVRHILVTYSIFIPDFWSVPASLWTSACIGLAVGIGFYSGAIFTTLGLILVFKYAKYIEVYVEEHSNTYDVYMEFENEDKMSMVIKKLREEDILISNVVIIKKRSKTQSVVIQATMEAAKWKARHTVFREVRQQEGVISVEEI